MIFTKPINLIIFLSSMLAFSQNTNNQQDNLSLDKGSLDNQFEYVIQKSSSWTNANGENFKVVKTDWLTNLKAHTLDSLSNLKKEEISSTITVKAQTKEINDLKTSLSNIQNLLNQSKLEKNNMSLFGAQLSKVSYSAIMWGIIVFLLLALLFFIYKFKNSNAITKQAKCSLQDLEDEFEEHRKTAVEREQRVRRQLQDEINKQKTTKPKKQ